MLQCKWINVVLGKNTLAGSSVFGGLTIIIMRNLVNLLFMKTLAVGDFISIISIF